LASKALKIPLLHLAEAKIASGEKEKQEFLKHFKEELELRRQKLRPEVFQRVASQEK